MSVGEACLKDEVLNELARRANVAQFVSFDPGLTIRHVWIRGLVWKEESLAAREAVGALLTLAPERSVNVRSFAPGRSAGQEFFYALRRVDEVVGILERLSLNGLYTIVNETVDVDDGGVSGVAFGGALEFAPGDTPRCVEKPGVASLPWELGSRILSTVYGFAPVLENEPDVRVEFSIHPVRRGYREEHTIVWERESVPGLRLHPEPMWPNRFSRWIGDKAFGLTVAAAIGLPVPRTTVIGRRVAPFGFGEATGTVEPWVRTCPEEQDPGRYTTHRGWLDPFRLLDTEDPAGQRIASIAVQEGVDAKYSGAFLTDALGEPVVEGTIGYGQNFMLGKQRSQLPGDVNEAVITVSRFAAKALGPIRFEWVYDGRRVWIVQLHRGSSPSRGATIYPGTRVQFRDFEATEGLDALRALVVEVKRVQHGVIVRGDVGMTSHIADLLRRERVPSRIERAAPRVRDGERP